MKWKILGIVCAIGVFAYLFFIFCESVQDNGMTYTFHFLLGALITVIFIALFLVYNIWSLSYVPKCLRKKMNGDSWKSKAFSILYLAVYTIILLGALKLFTALMSKYEGYMSYQKFIYRLERNIDQFDK